MMQFNKHPRKPSTYVAEDNDSRYRYTVTKTADGDTAWQLVIVAGGYVIHRVNCSTKKSAVELAERHSKA